MAFDHARYDVKTHETAYGEIVTVVKWDDTEAAFVTLWGMVEYMKRELYPNWDKE